MEEHQNQEQPINLELERRFTKHPLDYEQAERCERILNQAEDLAYTIDRLCPNSREKSLAWTALEECVMWANAAISRNE